MSKKSLLFFKDNSLKVKEIKAGDYAVANIGFFFQDVADKRAEIIIEGNLNISLTDSYKIVSKDEANELVKVKENPNDAISSLKAEIETLKNSDENIKKIESLENENKSLKAEIETLKSEIEALKKQIADKHLAEGKQSVGDVKTKK